MIKYTQNKDLNKLVQAAVRAGATVENHGSNKHVCFDGGFVVVHTTPSKHAHNYFRQSVRRQIPTLFAAMDWS